MSKVIEIIDSDEDVVGFLTPSASNADLSPHSQSRRRPRKSALQNLPDPDIQFETIAVDDDNSNPQEDMAAAAEDMPRGQQKHAKATPNILASRAPTNSDIVGSAFEEFVSDPEAKEIMETIALERVRINQLLLLFGMPDISFSLYSQPDMLKFQFDERIKQQKILQNSGRGQGAL